MLENNPMGSRRRRRFYHRTGIVSIPTFRLHEMYIVPCSFFSDEPVPEEIEGAEPKTRVVSVTTLMLRLIHIINQMMKIEQKEARLRQKARARARREGKWVEDDEEEESPAAIVERAIADILAMPDIKIQPKPSEDVKDMDTDADAE